VHRQLRVQVVRKLAHWACTQAPQVDESRSSASCTWTALQSTPASTIGRAESASASLVLAAASAGCAAHSSICTTLGSVVSVVSAVADETSSTA
jgi:hypothetical protein